MKQEEIDLIERYLKGEAGNKEREFVENLLSEGEGNLYLRNTLRKDWESILKKDFEPDVNLSQMLDRIHHLIRRNDDRIRHSPLQKIMRVYMRIAAIMILPLLVAGGLLFGYLSRKDQVRPDQVVTSQIYAPMGSRVSFNLPDGSSGMLNSGSQLTYSLPFTNDRKIILEGEAWFEVKSDETHPFVINSGNSITRVLGTKFNISAYPSENYVEIVLQEGKVAFQDSSGNASVTLSPSERLIFKQGMTSKSVVDPAKYNAWTEGMLVFRGDSMAEVARRIERWYNVKIILADKELGNYSFRATFQDDSLEEVLRFLSLTSPIRYKVKPRELMLDGTYRKEEVTIYMK